MCNPIGIHVQKNNGVFLVVGCLGMRATCESEPQGSECMNAWGQRLFPLMVIWGEVVC